MIAEAFGGNPSIVNYVMFVAVFGMLSLFYLIIATIKEEFSVAPMFVVIGDALNVLFFLVGGIALAAYLGAHSCANKVRVDPRPVAVAHTDPCTNLRPLLINQIF